MKNQVICNPIFTQQISNWRRIIRANDGGQIRAARILGITDSKLSKILNMWVQPTNEEVEKIESYTRCSQEELNKIWQNLNNKNNAMKG